jgi:hypothetical protein
MANTVLLANTYTQYTLMLLLTLTCRYTLQTADLPINKI